VSPVEWAEGDSPEPIPAGGAAPGWQEDVSPWYKRYAKALMAFLGTLTPAAVFTVLEANGVHLDVKWTGLITLALGTLAVLWGPKNSPKIP